MDPKTSDDTSKERFFELLREYDELGGDYTNYGKLDGEDFVVFQSWEHVEAFNAFINGFEGLKGSRPYLKDDETLADKLLTVSLALGLEPDNWNLKRQKETLTSHILYEQYIAVNFTANEIDPRGIDDFGIEWGFDDEYSTCCGSSNGCTNIVRTSPDSYSWTPPLFVDCEGYACEECCENGDYDDYVLEEYKNECKSIPDSFDLDRLGLEQINEEDLKNSQWYDGMSDDPRPMIEALNKKDIDVWFKVYPQQFMCHFDVYVKSDDAEKAKVILGYADTEEEEKSASITAY